MYCADVTVNRINIQIRNGVLLNSLNRKLRLLETHQSLPIDFKKKKFRGTKKKMRTLEKETLLSRGELPLIRDENLSILNQEAK